ncbi:MAG TPA: heparinase II/III family protein, partial [Balneolaceae bacterium]|nr:heparinase II/III family protein [Balneolaceae bacterium]
KSDESERERIPAKHQRAVLFLNNRYWVVIDHISTNQPRKIEPLWHFSPKVKVNEDQTTVIATDSSNNYFQLIPAEPNRWNLDMVKGRENNQIQGWYSEKYNSKVPNYCATYHTTQKDTSSTFAWVLYPSQKVKQKVNVEVLPAPDGAYKIKIDSPNNPETIATVRFYGKEVPLTSGLKLDGKSAIEVNGQKPKVANGVIRNENGKVVVED